MMVLRSVLLVLPLLLGGCGAPSSARQAATTVVDELVRAVRARETAYEDLLRRVVAENYRSLEGKLNAEWDSRRVELRLEVTDKVQAKRKELVAYAHEEMERALGPRVEQMSKALEQAKADVAAGRGGEEKRNELALQFAATLALVQKTLGDLDDQIDEKLSAVLRKALADVEQAMATNPVAFDPDAQTEAVLKDLRTRTESDYLVAFDQGATELKRFIGLDSAPALVLKGLFGEGIGDKLFTSMQSFADRKLQGLVAAADAKATKILGGQEGEISEAIRGLHK